MPNPRAVITNPSRISPEYLPTCKIPSPNLGCVILEGEARPLLDGLIARSYHRDFPEFCVEGETPAIAIERALRDVEAFRAWPGERESSGEGRAHRLKPISEAIL
jgi:hypothetical protein